MTVPLTQKYKCVAGSPVEYTVSPRAYTLTVIADERCMIMSALADANTPHERRMSPYIASAKTLRISSDTFSRILFKSLYCYGRDEGGVEGGGKKRKEEETFSRASPLPARDAPKRRRRERNGCLLRTIR